MSSSSSSSFMNKCDVVCVGDHSQWSRWISWPAIWFNCKPTLQPPWARDSWWPPSRMFSLGLRDFCSQPLTYCLYLVVSMIARFTLSSVLGSRTCMHSVWSQFHYEHTCISIFMTLHYWTLDNCHDCVSVVPIVVPCFNKSAFSHTFCQLFYTW